MATITTTPNGQKVDGQTIVPSQPLTPQTPTFSSSGGAVLPTVPTSSAPIDVSTLSANTAPIKLPPAPAVPNYDLSTLPSIGDLLAPAPTATRTQQDELTAKLATDTAKLGTKDAAQTAAEDKAARDLGAMTGLSDFTGQLRDITSQIGALDRQIAATPLQVQQDFAGRGATAGGVAPIEAAQNRQLAIKRLGLSAIAQTLQGNIATAQDTAQRAIGLEFAPVQAEIDFLKQAIADNKDKLTTEEQKNTQELQVQLQERQRVLDQQKQDKSTIISWAAEAAKNGASSLTINQAMGLTDPSQALRVLGPYLSDPVAKEQALANLALTRANTNKANAEAAQAANPALRPATQAQQTVAGYASRLVQANGIINTLSDKISKVPGLSYSLQTSLPSWLQTSTTQQYEQAKRNFVNAVLRQESGAAISESEFKSAEAQYFPQPGDSAETIQQKAANRDLVIRNFINASGSAYEAPPSSTAQTYVVNGVTYEQGTDGLYYPKQ